MKPGFANHVLFLLALCSQVATARSEPTFRSKFHAFTGPGTILDLYLHDLNADGRLDLVIATVGPNAVQVRLGDGGGDFEPALTLALPGAPSALWVGNAEGDAHPDLIVGHSAGMLSVFRGAGDGSFAAPNDFSLGGNAAGIGAGDLNGDGLPDLAVTLLSQGKLKLLFGFLPNFYFPTVEYATQLEPGPVEVRDLDDDGFFDVVLLNRASNTFSVFMNDGSANLASPFHSDALPPVVDLAVGDANEDGDLDLVIAHTNTGFASVFAGDGTGAFTAAAVQVPVGFGSRAITIAHFNADSHPDFLVPSFTSSNAAIVLGTGGGGFSTPSPISTLSGPTGCAAGDLDGDGDRDFVLAEGNVVSVHLGNGDATFGVESNTYAFSPGAKHVAVDDFDTDGRLDLAVTHADALSFLFGNGDGTFVAGPELQLGPSSRPLDAASGDFDRDGFVDLVTANEGASTLTIVRGLGNRQFVASGTLPMNTAPNTVRVLDLNADLDLDIVSLGVHELTVFLGDGAGSFGSGQNYFAADFFSSDLEIADLNEDGDADAVIAAGNCCPGGYWRLLGNGDGTFQPRQAIWANSPLASWAVGAGDVNHDGHVDLAMMNAYFGAGSIFTALGHGDGSFDAPAVTVSAFAPRSIQLVDMNGDDAADICVANERSPGTVSMTVANGDGTFGERTFFGISGAASFAHAVDLNADQALDLIVCDSATPKVWVLLNQGGTPVDAGQAGEPAARAPRIAARELANGNVRIELFDTGPRQRKDVLEVFDVGGRRLQRLLGSPQSAPGMIQIWDRSDTRGHRVSRGVYLIRFQSAGKTATRKIVLTIP